MRTSSTSHIVVVGAGIVGLAHAVAALDAGYRVTVLDQDSVARAASVRNFGHIAPSVHAGELAERARESIPIWLRLAENAGIEVRRAGTLVVARTPEEDDVLHDAISRDLPVEARLVTRTDVAQLLQLSTPTTLTGLLLPGDLTANPRTTVARIAAWIHGHERGDVRFSTTVHGIDTGIVETNRGLIPCDHVIVAVGHLIGRLFPKLAETGEVRECALQMARVQAPHLMKPGPAVITGTSMLRYGAFAGPATGLLRAALHRDRPDLTRIEANVMFTHQDDGTLLVGDSHIVGDSVPPFLDEAWSRTLIDEIATVLGVPRLTVLERWQGIYATSPHHDLLLEHPLPEVTVVTVTTGVGMTAGLGIGARTIAAL